MNIWFTSDHHFGHTNIIKYTNRPFKSVEEMDEELINRWNQVVDYNDFIYCLGDFTLGSIDMFWHYAERLKGKILIVPGGHDKRWVRKFHSKDDIILLPSLITEQINGFPFVLCHYPMLSWDRSHYGSIHLHGHTHVTIKSPAESGDELLPPNMSKGKRMDVGVDTNNFYPYSLEEILERLNYD